MMSDSNPIEDIFQEEAVKKQDVVAILDHLGQYGFQALAYGGEIGPLQTSLELSLKKGQSVLPREKELTESFIEGEGGRIATLIDQLNQTQHSQPKDDVFWWVSLMRHYRKPTRFLDFTRDIRLALFFAARQHKDGCKNEVNDLTSHIRSNDFIIYCLPCKHLNDADSNKTPFERGEPKGGIDMNRALGCAIDFHWMAGHKPDFACYQLKWDQAQRPIQLWGWDRPYYENPRLKVQKGMVVYPYDDYRPKRQALPESQATESWFVRNLRSSSVYPKDPFNIKEAALLPAKRIRIPGGLANDLTNYLKTRFQLTPATVYLDYERVQLG